MRFVPILFSTPMVKPILDGSKRQTRRKVKSPKKLTSYEGIAENWDFKFWKDDFVGTHIWQTKDGEFTTKPKANIGDILWVRETWGIGTRPHPIFGWMCGFEYKADELFLSDNIEDLPIYPNEDVDFSEYDNGKEGWKPSIFMPKVACRIFLKVTNVRVERLHDISEEDAKAEGVDRIHVEIAPSPHNDMAGSFDYAFVDYMHRGEYAGWGGDAGCCRTAKESFFSLWESINGKESLESNPWVWVYDFERIENPENFL